MSIFNNIAFYTVILFHINIKEDSAFYKYKNKEIISNIFIDFFCLNKSMKQISRDYNVKYYKVVRYRNALAWFIRSNFDVDIKLERNI